MIAWRLISECVPANTFFQLKVASMVKHELLREEGILIIRPEGSLEASDFQNIAQEIDPYIEAKGGITWSDDRCRVIPWLEGFCGAGGTLAIREEPPSEHRKNCCRK